VGNYPELLRYLNVFHLFQLLDLYTQVAGRGSVFLL
jgi:hypothetical protein